MSAPLGTDARLVHRDASFSENDSTRKRDSGAKPIKSCILRVRARELLTHMPLPR
jgi:hypothetical protein